VVLLAELFDLGVVATATHGRLITAIDRSLTMTVLPILLVLLVVHVLLLHPEVVLLLDQGGLVAVQVADLFLRGVGLLVRVDRRRRVLRNVVHWADRTVQLGRQSAVLDLRLARDGVVVLLVASDVVVGNQTVLLLLCALVGRPVDLTTLSTILLWLLLLLLLLLIVVLIF